MFRCLKVAVFCYCMLRTEGFFMLRWSSFPSAQGYILAQILFKSLSGVYFTTSNKQNGSTSIVPASVRMERLVFNSSCDTCRVLIHQNVTRTCSVVIRYFFFTIPTAIVISQLFNYQVYSTAFLHHIIMPDQVYSKN